MAEPFLALVKFVLLAVLYLFLARAVRAVVLDVYGPRRRGAPPPRPAMASPSSPGRSSRKAPRELVIHAPSGKPNVVPLGERAVTFGRAPGVDVLVDDVYISDHHAQVLPDGDGWSVRDLGSTNGTFLNGAKVTQPTLLSAGDQLRLGKTRVEVRR